MQYQRAMTDYMFALYEFYLILDHIYIHSEIKAQQIRGEWNKNKNPKSKRSNSQKLSAISETRFRPFDENAKRKQPRIQIVSFNPDHVAATQHLNPLARQITNKRKECDQKSERCTRNAKSR